MIIYKSPGWITDATLDRNGKLRIVSGDHRAEWHVIVAGNLVSSLERKLYDRALAENNETAEGMDTLELLALIYADRAENPFNEIKVMLDEEDIAWKHEFWGST